MTMNPQEITNQWLSFQKQSFETVQSIWQLTQTQTTGTVDRLLDQTFWVPKEGRQFIENWRSLMKKENDRLSAFIDRGFAIYEEMLEPTTKAASPTKTATKKDA
jgi:hypothetical protein